MSDWEREREECSKRTKKMTVWQIGKLEIMKEDEGLTTTFRIGKEKVDLDYWEFKALNNLSYYACPEKPEEAVLKKMAENGEKVEDKTDEA